MLFYPPCTIGHNPVEVHSMSQKLDVQQAIRRSMQTEKNAMDFYQRGASLMKNPDSRRVFETLAADEREHAKQFWDIYPGDDLTSFDAFMAGGAEGGDWLSDLEKLALPGVNERKAMEMAMDKELKLEQALKEMAARIDDPAVRAVFEENAKSTHHHYQLIESEYARLMGMVHETDIDTYVRE
jgi:rubrerythrin